METEEGICLILSRTIAHQGFSHKERSRISYPETGFVFPSQR